MSLVLSFNNSPISLVWLGLSTRKNYISQQPEWMHSERISLKCFIEFGVSMTQPLANQTSTDHSQSQTLESDEISLIDILRFLQRRRRVIGGATLVIILVGTALGLVSPLELQREILTDFKISSRLESEGISVNESEIEALALFELRMYLDEHRRSPGALSNRVSGSVESASISEASESLTHLRISLRSPTPEASESFWQSAYQRLQTTTHDVVNEQFETEVERLDVEIARAQNKVAFLREQINNTSTSAPNLGSNSEFFIFLQFQQQQAALIEELENLANLQFRRENLAEIESQAEPLVEVIILSDIQTQRSSLTRNLVLSTIAGLMFGILIGVAVDQFSRLRKEFGET